jgi:hypothetical protein
MQKARRHPNYSGLRPLAGVWFQGLFTPLLAVLFTFPSQYWFTIGLSVVFSLARWCWLLQTGFLRPRPTQDTNPPDNSSCTGLSPSSVLAFQRNSTPVVRLYVSPTTPQCMHQGLGYFRFRSPLLAESLLFSLPPGT